jgi:DNA-binding transcriptional MerR regulator
MVRIPENRRYFRIGEASRIVGVEPYVLRYWESEFSQIRPQRADSNQRTYRKQDLETLVEIKRLLYEEKMTIEGARLRFQGENPEKNSSLNLNIEEIKRELRQIMKMLD